MTIPERDEPWIDTMILSAVCAGATTETIAELLGETDAASRAPIRERVATLRRSGLLAGEHDEAVITDEGRQALLAGIAAWHASARALDEEHGQVERLRTDLLETISHELRTPLTLIRTSIGLLIESDPDEEMRQRLLRNIKQSTDRMHALVADILDLARMRGDRLDLQMRQLDLGELARGAATLMRPLFDARDQQVEIERGAIPPVPGDARRLERVLLNLLSNANAFAPAGSTITIRIRHDGEDVVVEVRDRGPGIPEEAMPHLFEQFFTARTSSTRHNIGVGLGLPIAKGIVEAHGGRIWVETAVGVGTAVSFALPTAWPAERDDENPGG